jgi:chromosome segregation ATPase
MGDQFNLSGDFRGAILNIKSRLTNVQQSIKEIETDNPEARQELAQLIAQLSDLLQKAPDARQEQVEAVAEIAGTLVEVTASEKPKKKSIQITGEGLKQAAKNLADVLPGIIVIATQIVAAAIKLGK